MDTRFQWCQGEACRLIALKVGWHAANARSQYVWAHAMHVVDVSIVSIRSAVHVSSSDEASYPSKGLSLMTLRL